MQSRDRLFDLFPLARAVLQAAFLTVYGVGSLFIVAGAFIGTNSPWAHAAFTIGATLITVGLSLPIAIHFQEKHNKESFDLLKSSEAAGIRSLLPNRRSLEPEFRKTVDKLATSARRIDLLGIAFKSLFDPDQTSGTLIGRQIGSTGVRVRVLLLDPKSSAAERRSKIEIGGRTLADIEMTIGNLLPGTYMRRLLSLPENSISELKNDWVTCTDQSNQVRILDFARNLIQLEVHLYEFDPIMMLMRFDDGALLEQYHFGRPNTLVPVGGCIGQHVPIVEYRRASETYRFAEAHFEYIWTESIADRKSVV